MRSWGLPERIETVLRVGKRCGSRDGFGRVSIGVPLFHQLINRCMARKPLGLGRATPPAKAAPVDAPPPQSRRTVRVGPAAVLIVVLLAVAAGLLPLVVPGTLFERDAGRLAAAVIFAASYVALAIGLVPGLAIDRAGVVLVGASLMVACGALTLDEAYKAVDLDTLTLLLGMMIVVANLRLSGFFALVSAWVAHHARRPLILLAAIVLVSGVFSAFLVNDAVCLVLAPLVMELTQTLGRNPVPYLLAVAMASNIGSTATVRRHRRYSNACAA